jgi:MFS family permease
MFLALVPVTLPVPGLHELVVLRYGVSEGAAHAFMTVNMLAGIVAVPIAMRRLRRQPDVRRWLVALFALDALAFLAMGFAGSYEALLAFRLLDGAVHLPVVTLLMVTANRLAGDRRGASLGVLASALMLGVTVGSPLGGWLVSRGGLSVYVTGAALLLAGAVLSGLLPASTAPVAGPGRRYDWDRRAPETWVPLGYAFMDRFSIGIFVSTFTLFLAREHGLSPGARGLLVALFMVPFALLCYPTGRLAERRGWLVPMVGGNVAFGLVYATYGLVPGPLLPVAMVLSGIASAFLFTPSLLLVSDLVKRGHGEGLFGAFQVAGSLGFLFGPVAGGLLVTLTAGADGRPAYESIFASVGAIACLLAAASWVVLRRVAAELRGTAAWPAGASPTSSV